MEKYHDLLFQLVKFLAQRLLELEQRDFNIHKRQSEKTFWSSRVLKLQKELQEFEQNNLDQLPFSSAVAKLCSLLISMGHSPIQSRPTNSDPPRSLPLVSQAKVCSPQYQHLPQDDNSYQHPNCIGLQKNSNIPKDRPRRQRKEFSEGGNQTDSQPRMIEKIDLERIQQYDQSDINEYYRSSLSEISNFGLRSRSIQNGDRHKKNDQNQVMRKTSSVLPMRYLNQAFNAEGQDTVMARKEAFSRATQQIIISNQNQDRPPPTSIQLTDSPMDIQSQRASVADLSPAKGRWVRDKQTGRWIRAADDTQTNTSVGSSTDKEKVKSSINWNNPISKVKVTKTITQQTKFHQATAIPSLYQAGSYHQLDPLYQKQSEKSSVKKKRR